MIDIGKILKRAWHILWNYKILWIFGILLVLTGASSGGNGGGNSGTGYHFDGGGSGNGSSYNPAWVQQLTDWFQQNVEPLVTHPSQHVATFIWIGVAVLLFILIVSAIYAIVRNVSLTSLIRMVNGYEETGTKVGFKQGWKMGWSRAAFRIWVINLIVSLPALVFVLILLALGVAVFFGVTSGNGFVGASTVITAIGCAFLLIFAFIVAGMVQVLLPRELLSRWVGAESGLRGIFLGTIAGAFTPGGPYVSLPIVAGLLKAGAGTGTMVAFLTSWSLIAAARLPMEVGLLGWKFTAVRLACTCFFAPIAGMLAHVFFRAVR